MRRAPAMRICRAGKSIASRRRSRLAGYAARLPGGSASWIVWQIAAERSGQVELRSVVGWRVRFIGSMDLTAASFGKRPNKRVPALNQFRVSVAPDDKHNSIGLTPHRN